MHENFEFMDLKHSCDGHVSNQNSSGKATLQQNNGKVQLSVGRGYGTLSLSYRCNSRKIGRSGGRYLCNVRNGVENFGKKIKLKNAAVGYAEATKKNKKSGTDEGKILKMQQ